MTNFCVKKSRFFLTFEIYKCRFCKYDNFSLIERQYFNEFYDKKLNLKKVTALNFKNQNLLGSKI